MRSDQKMRLELWVRAQRKLKGLGGAETCYQMKEEDKETACGKCLAKGGMDWPSVGCFSKTNSKISG